MIFAKTLLPLIDIAFPDVCLTPIVVPVPIPYPNVAFHTIAVGFCPTILFMGFPAHNLATTIPISIGDQPGVLLGVASGTFMLTSRNIIGSFVVFLEGLPADKAFMPTLQNSTNIVGITITVNKVIILV